MLRPPKLAALGLLGVTPNPPPTPARMYTSCRPYPTPGSSGDGASNNISLSTVPESGDALPTSSSRPICAFGRRNTGSGEGVVNDANLGRFGDTLLSDRVDVSESGGASSSIDAPHTCVSLRRERRAGLYLDARGPKLWSEHHEIWCRTLLAAFERTEPFSAPSTSASFHPAPLLDSLRPMSLLDLSQPASLLDPPRSLRREQGRGLYLDARGARLWSEHHEIWWRILPARPERTDPFSIAQTLDVSCPTSLLDSFRPASLFDSSLPASLFDSSLPASPTPSTDSASLTHGLSLLFTLPAPSLPAPSLPITGLALPALFLLITLPAPSPPITLLAPSLLLTLAAPSLPITALTFPAPSLPATTGLALPIPSLLLTLPTPSLLLTLPIPSLPAPSLPATTGLTRPTTLVRPLDGSLGSQNGLIPLFAHVSFSSAHVSFSFSLTAPLPPASHLLLHIPPTPHNRLPAPPPRKHRIEHDPPAPPPHAPQQQQHDAAHEPA
ncbi:hypothetical protein NEOLEDRAFT_1245859 [Neolentinus lepideus HHB14362 ss-1]|uniref:Uncharacterized protein n=1 Tax=Neolentinus lepideus HHB14362 ss-1 TaxID=1314782 RepID=A0A165NBT8_9AGAM|nr:hypothetical protein NEOLEDRAFT_1245859 [Neolentinus lepideus HHB14362 ss-1]